MFKINKFLKNPINKFMLWITFGIMICLIGINKTYAVTPDLTNHEFRALGVNNALLNCSSQGLNCGWNSYDMTIYSLGGSQNYNVTQFPIVPTGFTFNMYNGGVFVDGYVYTLNVIIKDNTSSLEYYRQWSYAFTTGYDNFTNSNEYAQILNTTVTKAGYNFTISIDFIAKDWFRYLRLNARAPFNDGKTYADITYVEQDIVYHSLKQSGTFTYGINNYTLSVMPYLEYQNNQQNQTIINQNTEAQNTRVGILGRIGDLISYINPTSENFFVYKLIELLVNALKSLFIPDDLSFLNTFKDTISNKLGFIASIPIQIIDFILDLPNAVFTEVNSLHFPRVNIFGYYFWDDMEIDLTIGKSIFSTIKYLTDLTCIVLCVNTLWKWYHSFTGGDTN